MKSTITSLALCLSCLVSSVAFAQEAEPVSDSNPELEGALRLRSTGVALTVAGIATGTVGLGLGVASVTFAVATTGDLMALPLFMSIGAGILVTAAIVLVAVGAPRWARGARQADALRALSRLPSLAVGYDRATSTYSLGVAMRF